MTATILNPIFDINIQKVNDLLNQLTTENSLNRINPLTGTAGFYMRHIAEAQILLSKMFFETTTGLPYGAPLTLRVPNDDGRLYDVEETKQLMQLGYDTLKKVIADTPDAAWQTTKTTVFGELTLLQGFSRILNHNAHHCGQIELAFKKGIIA
jgi:DinB superfamily